MYEDMCKNNIPDAVNTLNNQIKQLNEILKNLDISKDPYTLSFVLININHATKEAKRACDTVEWACNKQKKLIDG